ncbi:Dihydrofolate reductase [Agromyces sp. CF514]|uniref:dihydrofolate reductase family protein n=1 Tax=Agromyces sp. CF514 TaxID=1881031 RepID=UPI0008E41F08|nr:dihydrofolate reductase family protein [Agromyces sp. CF514]SFR68867.1 Dihydrofolate reductase [Agromyces sp. CF514]
MGRLVYTAITSLDGYMADAEGGFDWAMPSEQVHAAVNAQERAIGTMLIGRRMYQVLAAWEDMPVDGAPEVIREYAEIWRATDKVVYSSTLERVRTAKTRLVRSFDADAVRELVETSATDVSIGGPTLAAHALRAGLVDEYRHYVSPVVVGGGNPALPVGIRLDLELVDQRRFSNGVVYAGYRTRRPG